MPLPPHVRAARSVSAAVLASLALLTSCGGGSSKSIVVGTVTIADVVETVDAAGTVTPRSQAVLTSPDDAVVASVGVTEGTLVKQGDVLLLLSSPSANARLLAAQRKLADTPPPQSASAVDLEAFARQLDASAQASFASARAAAQQISDRDARAQALEQVAQSERNYQASRLQAEAAIKQTEQGLSNSSAALASLSDAQHQAAQAAVAAAQSAVTALTIRAPFAGTVTLGGPTQPSGSAVDLSGIAQSLGSAAGGIDLSSIAGSASQPVTTAVIEPGAHVSKGTPVATIVDATSLGVTANVDETDILTVKMGDPASVDLDAVPGAAYPATITGIDQLPVSSAGGSVNYRVRMALRSGIDTAGHLAVKPRSGMSAVARITVRTSKGALAVPASAIVRDSGRESMWVVRSRHAHLVAVTLAAQGADVVAVADAEGGLKAGDRVVIKGADRVKEGQKLS